MFFVLEIVPPETKQMLFQGAQPRLILYGCIGESLMPELEIVLDGGVLQEHIKPECSRAVLNDASEEEEASADSNEEGNTSDVHGWVTIIVSTDRKKTTEGSLVTSGVPLAVIVSRSENSTAIVASVNGFLELLVQEYSSFYDKIEVAFARSDNGSGTRRSVRLLREQCENLQSGAPMTVGGCYVHEMLKASQGDKSWSKQFGQLQKRWRGSGLEAEFGNFTEAYQEWMWGAVRCPTLSHFRQYGQLLADIAAAAGAPRSAKALSIKFGSRRSPFHSAAVGLPGIPSHQQSIESLQAFFDRRIYGRGLLSHKQYFQFVTGNQARHGCMHRRVGLACVSCTP